MKISATILVVDDDPDTLRLLALTLARAGHKPVTAHSWVEVNKKVEEVYRGGKAFDAVVLDLMMPERSGYDVLRSLQVYLHPLPPVIILSALTGINDAVKARELGAAKYLTKPTTPQKLLDAIREVMRK